LSLLVVMGLAVPAAAQQKISIAIYAPNAGFTTGTDRYNFVQRLAQQVSSVAGVPAEGKAFAKAADLEAAIKAKTIDFAVIDGIYLAQRGAPYPVLAIATSGGETAPKWALFASEAPDVKGLEGKKLSIARTGTRDDDFVGNALFDGELAVKRFFAGKIEAPDISSAVTSVKLHRAEAVFAPVSEGKGLKPVFDAGRLPNPAFCDVKVGGHPADLVSKVKSAVLSHSVGAALDGWRGGDAGPYRALAGRMGARNKRPLMAEPVVIKLEDMDVLVPPQLEASLPDLKGHFLLPNPQ
jgi:hypothetical protein